MRIFNSRFFTSATVAGAVFVLALSPFGLSVAQDEDLSISSVVPAAEVSIGAQYIDVDPNVKFDQAVLRVSGPDGYALTRTVSAEKGASYITADLLFDAEPARQGNFEEPLPWNQLPDGKYYFEIQFYSPDGSTERQSGSFKVEGGTATSRDQDSLSATHRNSVIERIAGTVLEWLMPSAHAQSVETHGVFGDFDDFVSIRNQTGTGTSRLNLNTTNSITVNDDSWRLVNNADSKRFEIVQGSGTDARLVILQSGNVGIGTVAPQNALHVNRSGGFQIRLTGSGNESRIDAFGTTLRMGSAANTNQFRIHQDAAFNSIYIAAGGDIGLGTGTPEDQLHVRNIGDTDTAAVRVESANATTANRRLFFLRNNGNPIFRFEDTSNAQKVWDFRLTANGFAITRVGSGALEMDLQNNGNVTFAGTVQGGSSREIKQGIEPLNPLDVLSRIESLPVMEWSYNASPEERRIGPMAEDFYEVFGLGSSDKHIAPADMAGVAMAAAQALSSRSKALEMENANLRERLERLEAAITGDSI